MGADHLAGKGKPFEGGKSGNPGGRPSFVKACQAAGIDTKKLSAELVEQLVDGMRKLNKTTASWRFCVEQLLHYRLGKPKDTIVHEFGDGDEQPALEDMTDEQLDDIIAEGETALEQMHAATEITEPDDPGDDV